VIDLKAHRHTTPTPPDSHPVFRVPNFGQVFLEVSEREGGGKEGGEGGER